MSERGHTVAELLASLLIMSLLAALVLPRYQEASKRYRLRTAARQVVNVLREARSKAIMLNREVRVEFQEELRRYGMRIGNKISHTVWSETDPVEHWIFWCEEVSIQANVSSIEFNPSGTANGGTMRVSSADFLKSYSVIVNRTGRIRIH